MLRPLRRLLAILAVTGPRQGRKNLVHADPSLVECEGFAGEEAPVLTVGVDAAEVERRLAAGGLACPGVRGGAGWVGTYPGAGDPRRGGPVAGVSAAGEVSRVRDDACAAAAGGAAAADGHGRVVGAAITARAAGLGAQPVAGLLDRPLGTVREWLRRFAGRVEAVRRWFTALLCAVAPDPVPPEPAGSLWADAVAAMRSAAVAVAARFAVTGVTVWQVIGVASSGWLLAPGWPTGSISTSSPWAALV
jgi:hypothetical protein